MSVSTMELKKSISDTERTLKSYGAVQETEWNTDKGEGHMLVFKSDWRDSLCFRDIVIFKCFLPPTHVVEVCV